MPNNGGLLGSNIGIVVAADVRGDKHVGMILEGQLEPQYIVFKSKRGEEIRFQVRDLTPEEIVAVINRALAERKLEFGFRPMAPDTLAAHHIKPA